MCANFSFKQEDELQSLGSFMSILNDSKMGVFSIFCMSGSPCEGGAMFLMKYCFFLVDCHQIKDVFSLCLMVRHVLFSLLYNHW